MAAHPKYPNAFSFSLLLSIIHFCHQSSSIHLKNLSKSQKHVYIINIGSYQYPRRMSFILSHINTFFTEQSLSELIFVTVQRVTQAVAKCDPGLYIFRVHQRSSVITKHGHMDTGDMGVLSQCLLSPITSCPDSRAHHQG